MARLEKQLDELHVMAREDREWRLSFWSNGSNRPLGFFQHRIQHDDARYGKLAETMATVIEGQASNASHLKLLVDREMQAAGRRNARREAEHKGRRSDSGAYPSGAHPLVPFTKKPERCALLRQAR